MFPLRQKNMFVASCMALFVMSLISGSQAFGPFSEIMDSTGLMTNLPESVNETLFALQEELEPVVTGLFEASG